MGYTLDEIANDITRKTPACFEPTIDYVVVKTPRWAFEKFPMADARLTTHMKSVGENMAIGRTFKEAFQKSMRSRELDVRPDIPDDNDALVAMIAIPSAERYDLILEAYRRGVTLEALFAATLIDEWFLEEFREIVEAENHLKSFAEKGGLVCPAARGAVAREAAGLQRRTTSAGSWGPPSWRCGSAAWPTASSPPTRRWTPARPSSRPTPPTSTPPTRRRTRLCPSPTRNR